MRTIAAKIYLAMLLGSLTGCIAEPETPGGPVSDLSNGQLLTLSVPAMTIADCRRYAQSDLYRPRLNQLILSASDDWQRLIEVAPEDTEILLSDGVYRQSTPMIVVKNNITVRSLSGNREAVHVLGMGYGIAGQGFSITGDDVTIAEFTLSGQRDHAIAIQGGSDRSHIYNLHVFDVGTQHIKGNSGGINDGVIACSSIGYTEQGAVGDYNGGIDLHTAHHWQIARNFLYNIAGDGSGCDVDIRCGTHASGPAILVWNNSSAVAIYDNQIVDSYRNIALGLGRVVTGGVVSGNQIMQSEPGDAGIELYTARDVLVERNTVVLGAAAYPGAIEYRDSSRLIIRNNTVTAMPWNRGGNRVFSVYDNQVVRAGFTPSPLPSVAR